MLVVVVVVGMLVVVVVVVAAGTLLVVVLMMTDVVVTRIDVVAGLPGAAAGGLIGAARGLAPPQVSMLAPGVQLRASRVRGPE